VTVSRTPQLTATKFLAFGDSITAGEVSFPIAGGILPQRGGLGNFLLRVVPSASYPTILTSLMSARYTAQASTLSVVNDGVPGERARDSATLARFQQALSTHRPDVVLLMHGYNDIVDPTVLSATVSAIDAMMAEARNRRIGRVVVLNLAPPRPGGNNSRPPSTVDAFNERLQRAVAGEGALYVDIFSALSTSVSTYIGVDGLHPNEAGYRKIAETVQAAIQANLEVR
jgi:lysophospholipase L1-like esterase